MAKVVHEIVSNVDTIIVLKNPCINFASWEDPEAVFAWETAKRESMDDVTDNIDDAFEFEIFTAPKKRKKSKKQIKREWQEERKTRIGPNQEVQGVSRWTEGGGQSIPDKNNATETDAKLKVEPEPTADEEGLSKENELVEEDRIHFHVCSGNLMSASPWFNRVLKRDGWMESNRNSYDKRFHVSAEDWDEEAFIILMNVFHLRSRQVPRTVTLELLAKIAVLVDYYDCNEAIELYTDMWTASLRKTVDVPTTYCRELMLWIWVSWVFKLSAEFGISTIVAIKQSTESVRNLGLPIPSWIIDDINNRRHRAIDGVISGLHDRLDTYRSANYCCPYGDNYSFLCGSMLLGALTKEMHSSNVLSPRPEIPFTGQSFENVCDRMLSMKSEIWYHDPSKRGQHKCNLVTIVRQITDAFVADIEGLNLGEKIMDEGSRNGHLNIENPVDQARFGSDGDDED